MSLTALDYIQCVTGYEQDTYTQLVLCRRDGPDGCEPDARRRWEEALRLVEAARSMLDRPRSTPPTPAREGDE